MKPELIIPEIVGRRCLLRAWVASDVPALAPACGDPEVCRFTTVPQRFVTEDARAWIERQREHARNRTAIVLAIVPQPGITPVGTVGLFGLNQGDRTARFGYWLILEQRGHGLATAATTLLARWAFSTLDLAAIHIDHEPNNQASGRVADKLGALEDGSRWVEYNGTQVELIRRTIRAPDGSERAPAARRG